MLAYLKVGLIVLLLVWAGWERNARLNAELEFADYQRQAVATITRQLETYAKLQKENQEKGAAISAAYQEGKRVTEMAFKDDLVELSALRVAWRVRQQDGGQPVSGESSGTGGPVTVACTTVPERIFEAAERVAEDLAACAAQHEQLKGLQRYVTEVCQRPQTSP